MIRRFFYPSLAIIFGIALLLFPALSTYLRTDGFFFDLASFLSDYPWFRFPLGVILLLLGAVGFVFEALGLFDQGTDFVIQQTGDGDFGNPELTFPKWAIRSSKPKVYKNLAALNRHDDAILKLDKDRIKDFYSSLSGHKRMAFLAVALFPFLVYAGYVVGNAGKRVFYYHYDRTRCKAVRLKKGRRTAFFGECIRAGKPTSSSHVICFSVSYPINRTAVESQFSESEICFYSLPKTGTEAVRTLLDLNGLADDMRSAIASIQGAHTVSVLLSCPAELCFALGQRLNSPGLPCVVVYNYDNGYCNAPWNWFVEINERQ